jgi:hypothetical protein
MAVREFMGRVDLFAYPVYGFNIEGREKIGSGVGMLCSILVFLIISTFTIHKATDLSTGKNPLISTTELQGQYQTPNHTLNVSKFPFAFLVEDYETKELKDDPSMVRFFGMMFWRDEENHLYN